MSTQTIYDQRTPYPIHAVEQLEAMRKAEQQLHQVAEPRHYRNEAKAEKLEEAE